MDLGVKLNIFNDVNQHELSNVASHFHIFALSSSKIAFSVACSGFVIGQPMPRPSSALGFGIMWKCTCASCQRPQLSQTDHSRLSPSG